jgi:glucose/arabinose dehydrogenase
MRRCSTSRPWAALVVAAATVALPVLWPRTVEAVPIKTVRVASGLARPLYVTAPLGDTQRLFIVEQRGADNRGRIKILRQGAILPTPFLTTDVLSTGNEQGLLGLAFDRDYHITGRFYINYTNASGTTIVARHTVSANPDVANPTGTVILTIPQPAANHNGGWLAFGPDNYLYIALGDGGDQFDPGDNAQNRNSLLGKILRIDVSGSSYTIPPGNPFAGPIPGLDEIWATGLRNPWRNAFDRETGDLVIADVGQNVWEEVNFAPAGTAGANYGWRCFEADAPSTPSTTNPCGSCTDPLCPMIPPAYAYQHALGRCSVTGGYIYRGFDIPDLRGTYFFADYCTGEIWSGAFVGDTLTSVQNRTVELEPAGLSIGDITSFGEDARGELYICDPDGEVYKIVPVDPADVEPSPLPSRAGLRLVGANPFRSRLQVEASVPAAERGSLEVLDASGRRVRTLLEDEVWTGARIVAWDGKTDGGRRAPSGIYWIRFRAGDSVLTERAVLIR